MFRAICLKNSGVWENGRKFTGKANNLKNFLVNKPRHRISTEKIRRNFQKEFETGEGETNTNKEFTQYLNDIPKRSSNKGSSFLNDHTIKEIEEIIKNMKVQKRENLFCGLFAS